jgi:hypothetical protein
VLPLANRAGPAGVNQSGAGASRSSIASVGRIMKPMYMIALVALTAACAANPADHDLATSIAKGLLAAPTSRSEQRTWRWHRNRRCRAPR